MLARYFVEEADADAAQDRGPGAGVAAAVGGGAPVPGRLTPLLTQSLALR